LSKVPEVTLGFASWPHPIGERELVFAKLIEMAINRPVHVVHNQSITPLIQIESVYNRPQLPNLKTRAYRFLASHTPRGIDFSNESFSPNQQPSGKAKFNIFFTGENERPPFGSWDCYLSFDLDPLSGKNAYLPLWWLTSSNLVQPTISPYLGREITLEEMMSARTANYESRKKFCVAFIGKAYPFRMQAIAALSKIGKVDVFGGISRNENSSKALEKYRTAQDYKFVFAFENDLYPGYVTEKAPEAWATGAIPLYWGLDSAGSLNPDALLNLINFRSLEEYARKVADVANSAERWTAIASQPLISTRPSLEKVIEVLRTALRPLIKE
jgi:hypothetical protein